MRTQMQVLMVKLDHPWMIRAVMLGAALVLAVVAQILPVGVTAVYAFPSTGGGGCSGG